MSRITALCRKRGRVEISLDGEFKFSLSTALAASEGLTPDRELSQEEAELLIQRDLYQRCLNTAGRLLSIRPRSDAELRVKLKTHGYNTDIQNKVIQTLRTQGLIDDQAFARFWAENRATFNPRSRRLTSLELRQKGVAREAIEAAVGTLDDEENAYRIAMDRSSPIHWTDRDQFRRRMGNYLERRGFGYGVIEGTLKKVWNELDGMNNPNTGSPDFENKYRPQGGEVTSCQKQD